MYKTFFNTILNFLGLRATFLIHKHKVLKKFSPNNTLLFDKSLSLLEETVDYFFVLCRNCDFHCLFKRIFFWTTNINLWRRNFL